jgi:hypothetical protein
MSGEGFSVGSASVIGSTEKALRVRFGDGALVTGEVWVPKSVIHDDSEVYDALNNARGKLVVESWFARKEGWDDE